MKKIICIFLKLLISGVISILILSVFCFFYSYSGIHIVNDTFATDYKWQSNQFKSNMTEGFAWIKLDKYGFNNINSHIDDIDILLMGSSHMEAVQIKQEENLSELLNKMLDYNVYNIGMSGHQIYNIANNFKYAINYYHPNKYIIIETDNIDLNCSTMQKVIDYKFERIPSYDTGFLFYAQKIPAVKNIYKQLQDWIIVGKHSANKINEAVNNENSYEMILKKFLKIISSESKAAGVKTIIFYHPVEMLNKDGDVSYAVDTDKLEIFEKTCEKLGIYFVNMTDSFYDLYVNEHKLAHGFNNTHIGTGHLNSDGHRVIANEIIKLIGRLEV